MIPMKDDKPNAFDLRLEPGEEPLLLTAISEPCLNNECRKCPGIFHGEGQPGKNIFCVHSCHSKPI
jgi:hypothetical protein